VIQRVLTALVGIPLLVTAIWFGAPWLTLLLLLVVTLGIWEFYRLTPGNGSGKGPGGGPEDSRTLPTLLGIIWVMAFVLGGQAATGPSHFLTISLVVFGCGSFLSLLWLVAFFRGPGLGVKTGYLIGGPLYVGFLLGHVLVLRNLGEGDSLGRDWVLFALLLTFATDTGAFLVGRAIGRHPMSPRISPNKTLEGAAGGFCLAIIAATVLPQWLELGLLRWQLWVIGATVGVVAQTGDLLESKLKRISGVKDTGGIIPGHGGILDRLDSLVISMPAVYYLVTLVFPVTPVFPP